MTQTFKKVASNGAASQTYARLDDTSVVLGVSHKPVIVKQGGNTTRIIKTSIDIRKDVDGKACDSACKPQFPAIVKLEFSAPEGSLPADFLPAVIAAAEAFLSSRNGVFFPSIDEITVA